MSEPVRLSRVVAGCALMTSAIIGFSIWLIDDAEPMLKIIGFTIAVGQAPLAAYLLAAIFEENAGTSEK